MQTLYFVATSGTRCRAAIRFSAFRKTLSSGALGRMVRPRLQPTSFQARPVRFRPSSPNSTTSFSSPPTRSRPVASCGRSDRTARSRWRPIWCPGSKGRTRSSTELDDESDYTTVEYKGELYFNASTPTFGRELYKVKADGSVVLVADLAPGQDSSSPLFGNSNTRFIFNDEFYFDTSEGTHALWKIKADGSVQAVPLPNVATAARCSRLHAV